MPLAKQWLASQSAESFGVPGVAAMELVMGCRDQADQRQVQKFITRFQILWPDASEFARAYDLLAAYRLGFRSGHPRLPDRRHCHQPERDTPYLQFEALPAYPRFGRPTTLPPFLLDVVRDVHCQIVKTCYDAGYAVLRSSTRNAGRRDRSSRFRDRNCRCHLRRQQPCVLSRVVRS